MGTSRLYTEKLCCSKITRDLILNDCIQEFLKSNKDFEGINITQDFILRRIARFYLEH